MKPYFLKLYVVECNLGKVDLRAMLVSSFPSHTRGDPVPLAGAPHDLDTQLLACSSSPGVIAIACCLRASLCFGFTLLGWVDERVGDHLGIPFFVLFKEGAAN